MADQINFGRLRPAEDVVREEAARQGLDPNLAARVAKQESGFQPQVVSPKGAIGTMQLMPPTAADPGVDPHNEMENIRGGVTYLRSLLDRYQGNVPKALAAYNAGMGRVDSGRPLPEATQQYVAAIAPDDGQEFQPTSPAKPKIDFSQYKLRDTAASPPTVAPTIAAAPEEETPAPSHWYSPLTQSIFKTATGYDVPEMAREKIMSALGPKVPQSMRGKWLADFADEASKAGPGFVDFLTSPTGIILAGSHLFPVTAPYAAGVDVLLGGWQALGAIPDFADAVMNRGDGRRWGKLAVDLLGAYAGLKGGAKVGRALREIPAETAARVSPTGEKLSRVDQMKAMGKAYGDIYRRTGPPPAPPPSGAELKARLEAAEPEDRPAIVAEAATPTTLRAKAEQGLYRTPYVRGFVNGLVPHAEQPPLLAMMQDAIDERNVRIDRAQADVNRYKDFMYRNVPEADRNVRRMGYATEGDAPGGGPLSPQAIEGLERGRELTRTRDVILRDVHGEKLSLMDPETYLRHYWDFSDDATPAQKEAYARRGLKDRALQERTRGSLKTGIEGFTDEDSGEFIQFKPKYEDVTEINARRHMEAIYAAENQRFANNLYRNGLMLEPTRENIIGSGWNPATDAPALKRAVYAGTAKDGNAILKEKPPLIQPDIEMAVNTIFNEPWKSKAWTVANTLRSFAKQIAVGLSMYHPNTISWQSAGEAVAAGGPGALFRAAKALAWPLSPDFRKGVKHGSWEVRGRHGAMPDSPVSVSLDPEAVNPWLDAGLNIVPREGPKPSLAHTPGESEAATISATIDYFNRHGPIMKALGIVPKTQYVLNQATFNYFLPAEMLRSAENLLEHEMNRLGPDASPELKAPLMREIADHVNRAFRTENVQRLMMTPKAQQVLGLTMFAPMWKISGMRALTKGYETTTGARLSNRFIAGSALSYFVAVELANWASSEWAAKHTNPQDPDDPAGAYIDADGNHKRGGHWTWQSYGDPVSIGGKISPNIRSHSAQVYRGQNKDGSQSYLVPGKSAQDAFLMLTHPEDFYTDLLNSLSVPAKELSLILSHGHAPSGYAVVDPNLPDDLRAKQWIAQIPRAFTPFAAQSLTQGGLREWAPGAFREEGAESQRFGMTAQRGASYTKAVHDIQEAQLAGRDDLVDQIVANANLNGISTKSLAGVLRRRAHGIMRTEAGLPEPEPAATRTAPPPRREINFGPLRPLE